MYDDRTNLAQGVTSELRSYFGELLYQTAIPRNVRLAEAPSHGKPALLYDPRSRGAEAYERLAQEILGQIRNRPRAGLGAEAGSGARQPETRPDTQSA